MKKVVLAVLCLVGVTVPALAQDYPKGEIFAGYSYLRADLIADHVNAHGFLVSVTGNLHKNFGIEGEIGGHYGNTPAGFPAGNYSNYTFLAGPKVAARYDKVTPWAHALFGFGRVRAGGESDQNFAMALGGGVDANVHEHVAIRVAQLDYVLVSLDATGLGLGVANGNDSHNFRFATGIVFKW